MTARKIDAFIENVKKTKALPESSKETAQLFVDLIKMELSKPFSNDLSSTVSMINSMKEVEFKQDLELTLRLLEHFLATGSFNLNLISNERSSNVEVERRESLIKQLKQVVSTGDNDDSKH